MIKRFFDNKLLSLIKYKAWSQLKGVKQMINSLQHFMQLIENDIYSAKNEIASIETWNEIVINSSSDIKIWAIRNKNIPIEILLLLVNDENENIRWEIATKNKLSYELFDILSRDSCASVRHRLVCNKNIPLTILIRLSSDSERFVRNTALDKLKQKITTNVTPNSMPTP